MSETAHHAGSNAFAYLASDGSSAMVLFALGVSIGFAHAFLPGHGKALVSARHALRAGSHGGYGALVAPFLTGTWIAGSRVLLAFLVVLAAIGFSSALGRELSGDALRFAAAAILVFLGLRTLWQARRHGTGPRSHAPPVAASLLVLALVPEPLAMALAATGAVVDRWAGAAVAVAGLGVGIALTLGLTGALAVSATRLAGLNGWSADPAHVRLIGLFLGALLVVSGLFVGFTRFGEA